MEAAKIVVLVIHIILTVGICIFVLLHAGKGGGLSGLFGGGGGGGPIGGTSIVQKNLDRITIAAAVGFAATTIALIFLYK